MTCSRLVQQYYVKCFTLWFNVKTVKRLVLLKRYLEYRALIAQDKPSLVTSAPRIRSPVLACGRVVVARPGRVVVSSGYFGHKFLPPQNANVRAFQNAFIS